MLKTVTLYSVHVKHICIRIMENCLEMNTDFRPFKTMHWISLFLVAVLCIMDCNGSNILIAPFDQGYNSRMTHMIKLGNILSKKGHNINFLCSNVLQEHPLFKLPENEVADAFSRFNVITYNVPPVDQSQADLTGNQKKLNAMMDKPYSSVVREILAHLLPATFKQTIEDMNTWQKISEAKLDLIIADEFALTARVLGAHFNVPVIAYSIQGPVPSTVDIIYPLNPSYVPLDWSPSATSDIMNFWQRCRNIMEHLKVKYYFSATFQEVESMCLNMEHVKKEACENVRNFYKTVSLVLMNRNDALHYPQPYMPNMVSIGSFVMEKPKPLTGTFKDLVEKSSKHGVIVVSFGSLFRRLPLEMAEIFAKAFATMDQTVIWSYEGANPEALGENTIINKWIPQNDLLGHSNVKLFVHHCGSTGTYEALYHAVPNVGIPFWADQPYNCDKLVNRVGSGASINPKGLTSEGFRSTMEKVINNATYKKNALKAADIYHNQPMDLNEKVVYWVEYVIRHKGAPHLRSEGIFKLNFAQYFLLDIVGLFTLIGCFILGILLICFRFMIKKLIFGSPKEKSD
ncbi:unnamed protein product [Owenia fusiformis]|uniref:Uncharacterized protein n=1 Tax=Owenia fusiformis TaxID=6347 RepID=A0A8J1TY54_OWEFU|nr:unnamed protein product [Owenia fusiformis]